jgi:hypothetical protein
MTFDAKKYQIERDAFLQKFSTTTPSGHRTFDNEKYYESLPTDELERMRDKTIADLKRNPNFGTQFYTDYVEYLNKKIESRKQ